MVKPKKGTTMETIGGSSGAWKEAPTDQDTANPKLHLEIPKPV